MFYIFEQKALYYRMCSNGNCERLTTKEKRSSGKEHPCEWHVTREKEMKYLHLFKSLLMNGYIVSLSFISKLDKKYIFSKTAKR